MTQNAWLISRKRNRPDEYVGYDLPYELAMQYLENMGYRILGESVVGETYEESKTELGRIISENPDVIVFPNLMSVSRQTEEVIEVLELLDRAGVRCEIANDSTAIDTVRIYMKLLNDCYSYVTRDLHPNESRSQVDKDAEKERIRARFRSGTEVVSHSENDSVGMQYENQL